MCDPSVIPCTTDGILKGVRGSIFLVGELTSRNHFRQDVYHIDSRFGGLRGLRFLR
jgi:hypothetical protein